MSKTILVFEQDLNIFNNGNAQLLDILNKLLKLEYYDYTKKYSKHEYVFAISHLAERGIRHIPLDMSEMIDSGFTILVDDLWDVDVESKTYINGNKVFIRYSDINWFYESFLFSKISIEKYENLKLSKNYIFLMLMNLVKPYRDIIWDKLSNFKKYGICSYVGKNVTLSNDAHIDLEFQDHWHSYSNFGWYDNTLFSAVVETDMKPFYKGNTTLITEKTFKPISMLHPFLLFGTKHTLAYLKSRGFETFPELFDESYDEIDDWNTRLNFNVEQVINSCRNKEQLQKQILSEKIQKKLYHNKNRFFNKSIRQNGIIDFVETQVKPYI